VQDNLLVQHSERDGQFFGRSNLNPSRLVRLPSVEPVARAGRQVRQLLRAGRDLLARRQIVDLIVRVEPWAQDVPLRLEEIGCDRE
jgi:hypothetical protein